MSSVGLGRIRLVAFDVDGVLTDGRFYLSDDGIESKAFHTQDGYGIRRLLESMLHTGNLTRHEDIFLVDDSRKWLNADENRQAVEKFNLASAQSIRYVGEEDQDQLLNELISALPAQEAPIRFLIDQKRWVSKHWERKTWRAPMHPF